MQAAVGWSPDDGLRDRFAVSDRRDAMTEPAANDRVMSTTSHWHRPGPISETTASRHRGRARRRRPRHRRLRWMFAAAGTVKRPPLRKACLVERPLDSVIEEPDERLHGDRGQGRRRGLAQPGAVGGREVSFRARRAAVERESTGAGPERERLCKRESGGVGRRRTSRPVRGLGSEGCNDGTGSERSGRRSEFSRIRSVAPRRFRVRPDCAAALRRTPPSSLSRNRRRCPRASPCPWRRRGGPRSRRTSA